MLGETQLEARWDVVAADGLIQPKPMLDALVRLDWIARVNEQSDGLETRYVLLVDPATTSIEPLARHFSIVVPDLPGMGESLDVTPDADLDGYGEYLMAAVEGHR